jgi:hypothetical protein
VFSQQQSQLSQTQASQTPQTPVRQDLPDQPKAQINSANGPLGSGSNPANNPDNRLFWALPNFLTVENASQIPPLTSKEKFALVAKGTFDPVEYPYFAFLAGISQAENSEPGFGQGWAGYGKRYGASFADGSIENFMVGAVFPSVLKEDPRYFQSGKGSFLHRAAYAVSRILITRTDAGTNMFNFSEVIGAGVTAGISNAYHPAGDRTFANTMSVWGTQMGWDSVAITVKEFWPDIHRKLTKHKQIEDP